MIQLNHPARKAFRIIFVGLLAVLGELQGSAAERPPKLNVLLILADGLRDYGGAFSRDVVKMPNLDRLRAPDPTRRTVIYVSLLPNQKPADTTLLVDELERTNKP